MLLNLNIAAEIILSSHFFALPAIHEDIYIFHHPRFKIKFHRPLHSLPFCRKTKYLMRLGEKMWRCFF